MRFAPALVLLGGMFSCAGAFSKVGADIGAQLPMFLPRFPSFGAARSGPARVSGPIGEHYFTPRDAIAAVISDPVSGGSALVILITNRPDSCDSIAAGLQPANAEGFSFALARIAADGKAIVAAGPGTFHIVDAGSESFRGDIAMASYKRSEHCQAVAAYESASGSVTLKDLAFDRIAGEFDVVFAGGGRIAGAFDASQCDALASAAARRCQ
jgi:hypothetical protein